MRTHVSKKLGLSITSHSQIQFVDIALNDDTKLFIDPCLIDIHKDKWSIQAKATIESYFNKFYAIYKSRQSNKDKLGLFTHSHEINATKLGYGNGNNGKAKTPEGMLETFAIVDDFFAKNINLSHPIDLHVLIQGIAEDCLSDMLTNILFRVLNEFTLEQCKKYGITSSQKSMKEYHFWDYEVSDWTPYNGNSLIIDNKTILLVPKWFIRQRYYYSTSQYFSMMILGKMQEEKTWIDPKGKVVKPSKKSLQKEIILANGNKRLASIEYTKRDPSLLNNYHIRVPQFYENKRMKDDQLDKIVYRVS